MTTIIIARHGQSVWNEKRILQGHSNTPLTSLGIKQVNALARRLKQLEITKIISSDIKRSSDTAKIIAKELRLPVKKHPGLNERSFGKLEGTPWKKIEEKFKDIDDFFSSTPDGGESRKEFTDRILNTFEKILSENKGERLLLVCHGGTMFEILAYIKKVSHKELDVNFKNTAICIFHFDEEKFEIELVSDSSHLDGLKTD